MGGVWRTGRLHRLLRKNVTATRSVDALAKARPPCLGGTEGSRFTLFGSTSARGRRLLCAKPFETCSSLSQRAWLWRISILSECPNSLIHELFHGDFLLNASCERCSAIETTQTSAALFALFSTGHAEGREILIMVNHVWQVI